MKTSRILFVPLNTNHALIFSEILPYITSTYQILSHDRIADSGKYQTGKILEKKNIPHIHFPRHIKRNEQDSIFKKLITFFMVKALIKAVLKEVSPKIVVLAVDNDPISNLFLKIAKKKNIKTIIIQEGSSRPDAEIEQRGLKQYAMEMLRLCGIQLSYILHGTSNLFDRYLVAGPLSKEVLIKRGVPEHKIDVTGQPKYDPFIKEAIKDRSFKKNSNTLLFAAGFSVISDAVNIRFLKELVLSTQKLGVKLTIKLHPRSSESPDDVKAVLEDVESLHCEVIKKGDETIELLKRAYGLITVASTVITEALVMDREGILANYLAKNDRLPYDDYDAVHTVENESELFTAIENSLKLKKPFRNKEALLIDNLFKLDGKSGERVAKIIEGVATEQ